MKMISRMKRWLAADKSSKAEVSQRTLALVAVSVVGAFALMPGIAAAAPWDSVADNVLGIFTNGLTRTIAIIAVIACGIAAMFGKLSWDWAIKIVVGITLIFGGAAIVDYVIAAAS